MLYIVAAVTAALRAVVDIARDPQRERRFTIRTFQLLAVLFAYCGVGFAILVTLFDSYTALAGTFFFLFLAFEGVLWLLRKMLRRQEIPRWIGLNANLWDVVLIGGMVVCVVFGVAGRLGDQPTATQMGSILLSRRTFKI